MKKVTVIGGGTGTFVVLSGLRDYPLKLSVIVSMMDSGGSTGKLRDQLGVLPPGDIRQCLVALSSAPKLWRELFLYRFEKGDLAGHNFGNILLAALEKNTGNYTEVIDWASKVLGTVGSVIPVTLKKSHLCVKFDTGEVLKTEGRIDNNRNGKRRIVKAFLEPRVSANEMALEAIRESDFIIFGPGDIYTSLIPNLVVQGVKPALQKSKAKIIYIANLMTKKGQTTNFKASDHLREVEKYLVRRVDYVVLNNKKIPPRILKMYQEFEEKEVEDDLPRDANIIRRSLISEVQYISPKYDSIKRSILRHDSKKLAKVLVEIIKG